MSDSIKKKYATYRGMSINQLRSKLIDLSNEIGECEYGSYSYDCLDLEFSIVEEVLVEKKQKKATFQLTYFAKAV